MGKTESKNDHFESQESITKGKLKIPALAGVAQWIERQPMNQRVTSLIPSRGQGQVPSRGHMRGKHTSMFLSLPSPLSKNKINKSLKIIPYIKKLINPSK